MDEKPIIRHCRNCEWCCYRNGLRGAIDCEVKYKTVHDFEQRITALFCRHYKQKEIDKFTTKMKIVRCNNDLQRM